MGWELGDGWYLRTQVAIATIHYMLILSTYQSVVWESDGIAHERVPQVRTSVSEAVSLSSLLVVEGELHQLLQLG